MLPAMVERMNQPNSKVDATIKEGPASTTVNIRGDKELARRKRLPYVPHDNVNPFLPQPSTLETRMPKLYGLHSDKTFHTRRRSNSGPKMKQFRVVLSAREAAGSRQPAAEETASMQLYLSAINNHHQDVGVEGPVTGRVMNRALEGVDALQTAAAAAAGRTRSGSGFRLSTLWELPELWTRSRYEAWRQSTPGSSPPLGMPGSSWRLPGEMPGL
ncbi:hypothetical protein CYMTET_17377 [Cymbomonas tetramitiformis]|uniref:Uncharacterized protein n=1 Tax=Cymbomonas tetramitiformis TaxID=36881 RepID=A0AAE0GAG5_9CHLO|nr:hypothetical protein CYMTET_17377 [Cymbomonas tetramitiformis]